MQPGVIKLEENLPIQPILDELAKCPDLWNIYEYRSASKDSPHKTVSDIWLRYNDINQFGPANYEDMMDEHDSVWYEAIDKLPSVKALAYALMAQMRGERLGGILISKLPAGTSVAPHVDHKWHAMYYQKFHVHLAGEDCYMYSGYEFIKTNPGDLYYLDSSQVHGVINNGTEDRLSIIVCIRPDSGYRVKGARQCSV